jgi:hypothetical protein
VNRNDREGYGIRCRDPHAEAANPSPFLAAALSHSSSAASTSPTFPRGLAPLHRPRIGAAATDRASAPPRHHTGALDPRPPTTVAAPRSGKEHAAPVLVSFSPLRMRILLAAVKPSRIAAGSTYPSPNPPH